MNRVNYAKIDGVNTHDLIELSGSSTNPNPSVRIRVEVRLAEIVPRAWLNALQPWQPAPSSMA